MNYTDIFYLGPEHIVSGYHGDYRLSPGRIRVESWMGVKMVHDFVIAHFGILRDFR